MKITRKIFSHRKLNWMFVLPILLLAAACGQSQDGVEVPTSANLVTSANTGGPTPSDSRNTITAAAAAEQFPMFEMNSSGVTGTCTVSRSHDGSLVWKVSLSNVTPGHTIFMGIYDKNVGLVDGVEVDARRQIVRSGRQKSSGPSSGTTMFCRGGDNASGPVAATLDFSAP